MRGSNGGTPASCSAGPVASISRWKSSGDSQTSAITAPSAVTPAVCEIKPAGGSKSGSRKPIARLTFSYCSTVPPGMSAITSTAIIRSSRRIAGSIRNRRGAGSSAVPVRSRLDSDENEQTRGRLVAVLRVLGLQQLERPLIVLDDLRPAGETDPPQAPPVLVPVVDHDLDLRVRLDVGEPSQPARRLRLLVHSRDQRVAVEREADRDDVRPAVGADRGEPGDPRGVRVRAH